MGAIDVHYVFSHERGDPFGVKTLVIYLPAIFRKFFPLVRFERVRHLVNKVFCVLVVNHAVLAVDFMQIGFGPRASEQAVPHQ